jgi:hypothetical protein
MRLNMKMSIALCSAVLLTGCATMQFEIKEADTRLTNISDAFIFSENNRISTKSIAGGLHIDNEGVFVNPFVIKSVGDSSIKAIGFVVKNITQVTTIGGGPNTLGDIRELNCILNGKNQITINLHKQNSAQGDTIGYNTIARYAYIDKVEGAVAITTIQQFKEFSAASAIACRVTGTVRSVIYEEKDVSPQFLQNIRRFYEEKVK